MKFVRVVLRKIAGALAHAVSYLKFKFFFVNNIHSECLYFEIVTLIRRIMTSQDWNEGLIFTLVDDTQVFVVAKTTEIFFFSSLS